MTAERARTVVATQAQADELCVQGIAAEPRSVLRNRLLSELAPEVVFVGTEVTRLLLSRVLPAAAAGEGPVADLAKDRGAAWLRVADDVDEAVGVVRRMDGLRALTRVGAMGGAAGARARLLERAIVLLDEELARLGKVDARAADIVLARTIAESPPERVARAAGARRLVARGVVRWDPAELAWWRALDESLARSGGRALVTLPGFEQALDAARERGPLEVIADHVAHALDDAPEMERIEAPLGDLRVGGDVRGVVRERVELLRAADAVAAARAVADVVRAALAGGTPVDRVAIALPSIDPETLGPLRRALVRARIPLHAPEAEAAAASGLVDFAFRVLVVSERGLAREEVAALLPSRRLDAVRLTGIADAARAERSLRRLARALASTPTVRRDDPVSTLEATAAAFAGKEGGVDLPGIARRVATALSKASRTGTRQGRAEAARALWGAIAQAPAARFDGEALGGGERGSLAQAGLAALARDARGYRLLDAALDAYVDAARALGMADRTVSAEEFRHEVRHVLAERERRVIDAHAAGAVRIAPLAELAGRDWDLLVVMDGNEGHLPPGDPPSAFLPPVLEAKMGEVDARSPGPRVRSARGLADVALAAARAQRIVLAYRDRDEAGAPLAPAPLLSWLSRAGVRTVAHRDPLPLGTAPSARRRAEVERARESFFAAGASGGPITGVLRASSAVKAVLFAETGAAATPLSITALERFAACPFQGFASQVLGARERRRASEVPDALDSGILIHGALAAAFRATVDLWSERPRDAAAIRARGLAAADAFLDQRSAASGLRCIAIDHVRRDVERILEWSLADLEWDFVVAEQTFGDPASGWDAVRIEGDGASLGLRGQIDRVDRAHGRNAVRVIDYKLGERGARARVRVLGELAFQLPVYGRAAAVRYGARAEEGMYLPTRAPSLAPGFVTKGSREAWTLAHAPEGGRSHFETRALAVALGVRGGDVSPSPREKAACERCGFDGGCRKPRFAIAAPEEES